MTTRPAAGWAITGMGAIASIGEDVGQIFDALCRGESGLDLLKGFQRSNFRVNHAYEIDDRPEPGRDVALRATRWLEYAVRQALADAGLPGDLGSVPVLVGTTLRELRSVELWARGECELDPRDLHFGTALRKCLRATSSYSIVNACAASLYALGMGTDLLALDMADTVVVAGVDAITESSYGLLDRVNNEPPTALRPFDQARRGMLMGEGAVAVVLRRANDIGTRRPHAWLRSVSMNCDAHHPTAPDPKSIALAIEDAHVRGQVRQEDIDLVMLHGSGTHLNDEAEAAAMSAVFSIGTPVMTAIKSMTGHTAGGSGLLSLVVAAEAMKAGRVPPVLGLTDPIDEAAGFRFVRGQAVDADISLAQVNAFGFGGLNSVTVLEKVT